MRDVRERARLFVQQEKGVHASPRIPQSIPPLPCFGCRLGMKILPPVDQNNPLQKAEICSKPHNPTPNTEHPTLGARTLKKHSLASVRRYSFTKTKHDPNLREFQQPLFKVGPLPIRHLSPRCTVDSSVRLRITHSEVKRTSCSSSSARPPAQRRSGGGASGRPCLSSPASRFCLLREAADQASHFRCWSNG